MSIVSFVGFVGFPFRHRVILLAILVWLFGFVLGPTLLPLLAYEASSPSEACEKTLSPYFMITSGYEAESEAMELFPLEETKVDAVISGVIADVTVRQTYRNTGKSPIGAVYVFPASTRAAVHALRMTIGARTIEAVVKERTEARKTFEDARKAGKSASLLEQQRPNVFQMNVANILPGDRIEVELQYAEMLVPEHGTYTFVYPTVVGPRYSNRLAAAAPAMHRWVSSPFLGKGAPPVSRLRIAVALESGLPLKDVGSPSHVAEITYSGPSRASVGLSPQETNPGNRDFILHYRLQDDRIETGLLLDERGDERFFLLMVQPPERVKPSEVPPREYVFVVDVSGSMDGFPLSVSKRLIRGLLSGLRPQDTFNVILFAGGSELMAPASVPATSESVATAIRVIDSHGAGGGTELLRALDVALALPASDQARSIVVITDGYVDVESEAFDRIRKNAGRASVFAFGIGESVNRFLIEGLAHAGQGEPFIVTRSEEADAVVPIFQRYVEAPLLTDVTIDWGELGAYDVEPAQIPILTSERPLIVCGKWRGRAEGLVEVRGRRGSRTWSQSVPLVATQADEKRPGLRYLWARERLRFFSDFAGRDESAEQRQEIVSLGLRYNLLTRHTSFVAVDHEVRNPSGESDRVHQPLPLPEGVSEMAVGAPGTPEPGTLILLTLAGGAAARHWRKTKRKAAA